jgi:hypothetical protein
MCGHAINGFAKEALDILTPEGKIICAPCLPYAYIAFTGVCRSAIDFATAYDRFRGT